MVAACSSTTMGAAEVLADVTSNHLRIVRPDGNQVCVDLNATPFSGRIAMLLRDSSIKFVTYDTDLTQAVLEPLRGQPVPGLYGLKPIFDLFHATKAKIFGRPLTSTALDDVAGNVIGQESYYYHLGLSMTGDSSMATFVMDLYALLEYKAGDLFTLGRERGFSIDLPEHRLWSRYTSSCVTSIVYLHIISVFYFG